GSGGDRDREQHVTGPRRSEGRARTHQDHDAPDADDEESRVRQHVHRPRDAEQRARVGEVVVVRELRDVAVRQHPDRAGERADLRPALTQEAHSPLKYSCRVLWMPIRNCAVFTPWSVAVPDVPPGGISWLCTKASTSSSARCSARASSMGFLRYDGG